MLHWCKRFPRQNRETAGSLGLNQSELAGPDKVSAEVDSKRGKGVAACNIEKR
jgi:hypothetical protein